MADLVYKENLHTEVLIYKDKTRSSSHADSAQVRFREEAARVLKTVHFKMLNVGIKLKQLKHGTLYHKKLLENGQYVPRCLDCRCATPDPFNQMTMCHFCPACNAVSRINRQHQQQQQQQQQQPQQQQQQHQQQQGQTQGQPQSQQNLDQHVDLSNFLNM